MLKYEIFSRVEAISKGVLRAIESGFITKSTPVIIYGFDRYSFAIRTILSNLGLHNVECFISDDEALVLENKRRIEDFASHYLNNRAGLIYSATVEERLARFDDTARILIASEDFERISNLLDNLGYKKNKHYYVVYSGLDEVKKIDAKGSAVIGLPALKNTEKEILAFIDRRCTEQGIRYWVCGGTLLGTIRHQGFIPWDDDIDIFMPWEDYKRFIASFCETDIYDMCGFGTDGQSEFPDPFCKVVDKRTLVIEDIGTLVKLNGVWVDIFPLVGLPESVDERKAYFANYQELNRQIWQDFYANNGDAAVFGKWYSRQLEFMDKHDFDGARYVGVLGTAYKDRDCTSKEVYNETIRMKFEDIEINVPVGYDEYLTNLYGSDYMQLPPIEKRKTHHNTEAFWVL